jgi:hypothetical protein
VDDRAQSGKLHPVMKAMLLFSSDSLSLRCLRRANRRALKFSGATNEPDHLILASATSIASLVMSLSSIFSRISRLASRPSLCFEALCENPDRRLRLRRGLPARTSVFTRRESFRIEASILIRVRRSCDLAVLIADLHDRTWEPLPICIAHNSSHLGASWLS